MSGLDGGSLRLSVARSKHLLFAIQSNAHRIVDPRTGVVSLGVLAG